MSPSNTARSSGGSASAPGDDVLRAQLAIEPDDEASCIVVDEASDAETLTHQRKVPRSCIENANDPDSQKGPVGECHTEISDSTEHGERTYLKSAVTTKCICPVFDEHDCIPEIKGVRSGSVVAVVTIRNRNVLQDVLRDLRAVDARVSIEWLVRAEGSDSTAEIDISNITTKQRETLETALEAGYYETPRETSLSELAEQLSISESAVSQRLNAAETKLVRSFLDE